MQGEVADEVIADYVEIANSNELLASLGITNLVSEVLLTHITNNPSFWTSWSR